MIDACLSPIWISCQIQVTLYSIALKWQVFLTGRRHTTLLATSLLMNSLLNTPTIWLSIRILTLAGILLKVSGHYMIHSCCAFILTSPNLEPKKGDYFGLILMGDIRPELLQIYTCNDIQHAEGLFNVEVSKDGNDWVSYNDPDKKWAKCLYHRLFVDHMQNQIYCWLASCSTPVTYWSRLRTRCWINTSNPY